MPARTRLKDVWVMDWDSSVGTNLELTRGGYYAHPHADVSADVDSYLVRWGTATEADPNQIELTSAKGVLRLYNRDNRYDPESGNPDIGKSALRKPHLVVLLSVDDTPIAGPFEGVVSTGSERDGLRTNLNRPSGHTVWPSPAAPFRIDGVDYPVDTNFLWRQQSFRFGTTPVVPLVWLGASRAGVKVENLTTGRTTYMPFRYSTVARTLTAPFGWQTNTRTNVFRYISPRGTAAVWDTQPGKAGDYVRVTFVRRVHVAWEGVAINGLGTQLTRQSFVDFELVSRGYRWFREEKQAFEITQYSDALSSRLRRTIDPRKEDGSPAAAAGADYDQNRTLTDGIYDPNLSRLIAGQTIGFQRFPDTVDIEGRQVNATGTTNLGFLNACARYANGWAVENRLGKVGILAWAAALAADSEHDFNSSFKIRQEDAYMEFRHGYIRNYAEPKAKAIHTPAAATQLYSFVVDLGGFTRPQNRWREFNLSDSSVRVPYGVEWPAQPVSSTVTPATASRAGRAHLRTQTAVVSPTKLAIELIPVDSQGNTLNVNDPSFVSAAYTITVSAKVREVIVITPPEGAVRESVESIPDFGVRRLMVPPWYPLRQADENPWTHLTDFVNRLATPLRYFRLTFPRTHADAGKLAEIDSLDAGSIFDIDFVDPVNPLAQTPVRAKVLIVGVRLEHQRLAGRTPFKTVYGITLEVGNVTAARWSHGDTWSGAEKDYWG